jgi:hypothetical protein
LRLYPTPNPNPIPQSQNPAIPIAAPLALLRRSNNYRIDSIAARFQLPRHSNYRPDPIAVPIPLPRLIWRRNVLRLYVGTVVVVNAALPDGGGDMGRIPPLFRI